MRVMTWPAVLSLGAAVLTLACARPNPNRISGSGPGGSVPERFDTRYDSLDPRQQNLVAEWIQRYNRNFGKSLEAKKAYNELPLSSKTTFEAVTHALMWTPLTGQNEEALVDDGGRPLDALDLVEKLDATKGKLKGAGGDVQFRIYVQLKSDAVRLLNESREFSRGADNLVYHRGYPVSFRSTSGVPSIQFSVSDAGDVADIDVDYRSSTFPAALFNGHLTSANSDVRAGDNHRRHVKGWDGLEEWWTGWGGLGEWWSSLHGVRGSVTLPGAPRRGDGPIELAVFDFLSSWLVEQNLDVAVSYFSDRAYECLRGEDFEGSDEVPPQQVLRERMAAANDVLGRHAHLEGVVEGVHDPKLGLRRIENDETDRLFVLSDVPQNRVVEFHCAFRGQSVPKAYREAAGQTGEHRLATFLLRIGEMRGATLSLLWSKEAGLWRIVSYELEAAVGLVPDLRTGIPEPRTRGAETLPGDPDFVERNSAFLEAWIVEKDYEKALELVSVKAYPCVEIFADIPRASDAREEPGPRLRRSLQSIADFVGDVDRDHLGDAIEGVVPRSEELKVLQQSTDAYVLLSLPDGVAESLSCAAPLEEREPVVTRGPLVYENYYGTSFRLKLIGEEPAAFLLIWARENDAWKVVAFDLVVG